MTFRPLLAAKADLNKLSYPNLASPKYDGFRCLINAAKEPVSRSLKPIANHFVRGKLKELNLPRLDGELMTYTNGIADDFNTLQSKLSTRSGMPDFKYHVFDDYSVTNVGFVHRLRKAEIFIEENPNRILEFVNHKIISDEEELAQYEAQCLENKYEGVMIRSFSGPYKQGRSTVNEGTLLKLKRFFDKEAIVVSAHELMRNLNEPSLSDLGYMERSSHKENKQPAGMLGKLRVRWRDVQFEVGTGFTEQQRISLWKDKDNLVGKTITVKYQDITPDGKPRFPVFLGFRHDV